MPGGNTSLRKSLSEVLTALRHLEEVHNRRFVRVSQASNHNVRCTSDADADGPQPSAGSEETQRHVFDVIHGRNFRHLQNGSRSSGSVHSQLRPLPLVGTEAEKNDAVTLHVFGGGLLRPGTRIRILLTHSSQIQFQDYDFFSNWVGLQMSSSWISERSTVSRGISSWLFSTDICRTDLPEYDEFRPQLTSTPRRRDVGGAACPQCGIKHYDPGPRSRLRILRQP
ncbi:hypothetical protein B0H14DRAFT_2875179 [Mycena olivaceomarginata]|nr:hypothetical protein B0H14DRAFT_2875179 [Mycena olivaceomarginata]